MKRTPTVTLAGIAASVVLAMACAGCGDAAIRTVGDGEVMERGHGTGGAGAGTGGASGGTSGGSGGASVGSGGRDGGSAGTGGSATGGVGDAGALGTGGRGSGGSGAGGHTDAAATETGGGATGGSGTGGRTDAAATGTGGGATGGSGTGGGAGGSGAGGQNAVDSGADRGGCLTPRGCCMDDSDCAATEECAGTRTCSSAGTTDGVCKPRPTTAGQCWRNSDCAGLQGRCLGAQVCPCGTLCLVGDQIGTCGRANADAGAGCDPACHAMNNSNWCTAPSVEWVCSGQYDPDPFRAAGCTDPGTNAIRYCCPLTFMSQCR